jgi:hypothetical protein
LASGDLEAVSRKEVISRVGRALGDGLVDIRGAQRRPTGLGPWLGCWISAASADSTGCTSYDEGGQGGANEGPNQRTDEGQIEGKAAAEPGGDAPGHQPGCPDPWSAPSIESCCVRFGVRRSLRSSAGSQERDQQCWSEKVADVPDGIAWSEIGGLDDIHDMDDGRPNTKDRGRDDGGLAEAIAPTHGDNAKDADGQVGDADLELKGIPGRPADGLRDRVRKEDVAKEATDSASGDPDPKEVQQKDFQPALAAPTTAVHSEMANTDDDRADREAEDADRNTVHVFPSSSDIVWLLRSHVIASVS